MSNVASMFEPPAALKDAENNLQFEQRLLTAIDSKIGSLQSSFGLAPVLAVPSDGEAHQARKLDLENAQNERAEILARIECLSSEIGSRRKAHGEEISTELVSARKAAASDFLAAAEALTSAHRRLEQLRALGRAAGISTKASILPLHLNAAIILAQAIEEDPRV